jgi:hypothetical protein
MSRDTKRRQKGLALIWSRDIAPQGFHYPCKYPFNNMSMPPGVIFVPLGEYSPLCSPPMYIGLNTLHCLEEWRGEQSIFTPTGQLHTNGTTSPLGDNLAPGVKLLENVYKSISL